MNLDEAIELAALAHRGQLDKKGEPYILHPLRVMQHLYPDQDAMMVGVLHDTIEDTFVTEEILLEKGMPLHLVEAVSALTRREGESYREFIERIAPNALARKVKIKDLEDNMSKARNPPPLSQQDSKRLLKYRKAHAYLYAAMTDDAAGEPIGTTISGKVDAP